MKGRTGRTTLRITVALTGVMLASPGLSFDMGLAEAEEVDEGLRDSLVLVRSRAELGLGFINEDNTRHGEFRGLTGSEAFPVLELDLHERPAHDADEMRWRRFRGRDLGLDSRSFLGEFGVQGDYRLYLGYDNIPWNQWPDLETPFSGTGSHQLTLPDSGGKNQIGQHLRPLDIDRERETLSLGGDKLFAERWRFSLDFEHEKARGTRLRGFGKQWFDQQSFLAPEPLDTTTNRVDARFDYQGRRLQGSAAWHLSLYSQNTDTAMTTEDPHATDWSQAPEETWSLNPDNLFSQLSLAGGYTVRPGTRVSGDLHAGRMLQDENFVEDAALVEQSSLDGQINTTTANLRARHRFHPRLRARASWRYDDRDNRTDVFTIDGRDTRAPSLRRETWRTEADYRLFRATNLKAGFRRQDSKRDDRHSHRRETEADRYHLELRTRWFPRVTGGVRGELEEKRGTVYDRLADDQSPESLRNFDLADRDSEQLGLFTTVTPFNDLSLSGRMDFRRDDYRDSELGRTHADRDLFRLDGTWTPGDGFRLHGFWSYEDIDFDLVGEDWAARQDDQVLTFGGGLESDTRMENLSVGADLLRVETMSRFGDADNARFPTVSTRLARVSVFGDYEVDRNLSFRARYMIERFRTRDWNLDRDPRDFDDVLVVGRENPDYTAHLIMASGTWRF